MKNFNFAFLLVAWILTCSCSTLNQSKEIHIASHLTLNEDLSIGDQDYERATSDLFNDQEYGRKVVNRDVLMLKRATMKSGEITMKICVNREGIVQFARIINKETTIQDKKMLAHTLKSISNYQYEEKADAPEIECGKYKLKIDTQFGFY